MTAGTKLIGFGMRLQNWSWMGSPPCDLDPGDVKRLSEEEYWYLKTMWPDYIYNLTPKPSDPYRLDTLL